MTRKSVFRDMDVCVNCKACIVACKVKHQFPPHTLLPAIEESRSINLIQVYPFGPEMRRDRVYQSFVGIACMHCEDPPCMKVCPTKAVFKDSQTHITLVHRNSCIGCKACLWVCPFGAPSFDEDGKMVLCDLCIDRLREGKQTACEAACQARAIFIGSPEEIAQRQAKKAAERIGAGYMEQR
jgi:Fe-S-cluster-containing dehydrogenase component